ncbi:MAG: hypothetical protein QY332_16765 [Anaerolineales bacterium]|nr:MAG: hypothetical protein QY332_16765 [Anaerolineales bacterium]
MKTLSVYWILLTGALSALWQVATYYLRFGQLNPHALLTDYLLFFLAGALGGWILLFFFNRQTTNKARWSVLIAFLLAFPVAMFFMLGGGLLGWVGTLLFPQIPFALFTWIGSLVGKSISR